jgi:hypothetical protein
VENLPVHGKVGHLLLPPSRRSPQIGRGNNLRKDSFFFAFKKLNYVTSVLLQLTKMFAID